MTQTEQIAAEMNRTRRNAAARNCGRRYQMTVTFAANGYETRLRNLTEAQVDEIEGSMRLYGERLSNILRRVQA